MTIRDLRNTSFTSREELADSLQCLFVSEVIVPSNPLWIITPQISDVPLIDNRAGRFAGLIPALPPRWIRLSEVLEQQLTRGGSIVIVCSPNDNNRAFTNQLQQLARKNGNEQYLSVRLSNELHNQGILSETIFIRGSINLTHNGLRTFGEIIQIVDEKDRVAETRFVSQKRWSAP